VNSLPATLLQKCRGVWSLATLFAKVSQNELSAKILIVFNLVRAPATFLEYSFVAFEILILNLSSSRFFLASALKLNQLQSAHCPWLQSSGESDTCITSFFIPPSPNNFPYNIILDSSFFNFSFEKIFKISGCGDAAGMSFSVDLSFVRTLWTHTILHIFPRRPISSIF